MLKNYFKIALRNLARSKVFSFINILGLALGMGCSLLIMLWVQDERGIDAFHANGKYLHTMYERHYNDGKVTGSYSTPGIMYAEMKKVVPEVKYATPYAWNELVTFRAGDKIQKAEGNYTGEDFFKMFSYPLLQGDVNNTLNSPLSIAISRKMATDFFGSPEQAMGQTLRYQDQKDLTVTAVFEDVPAQSRKKFDFLINWEVFLESNAWARDWTNNGPTTYIMLHPNADAAALEKKLTKFLDNYNKEQDANFRIELGMQRYDEMYLHSNFGSNGDIKGGRIEYVKLFTLVAIFILVIACINFMNLSTARSVKRAKEIGVRKVVGAVRTALVGQFIGEALLLAFIAVLSSLVLVTLLLPTFNSVTGKQITFPAANSSFWLTLAGLTFVTGLLSGSYPALFLSSFSPIKVLKGTLKFTPSALFLRRGLVVFQFVLSIVLIIGTIIVSKQINYIQSTNLGYDRENLLFVPLEGELLTKYAVFKEEALKMPGIQAVTRMSQSPTQIENSTGGVHWEGKDPNSRPSFTHASVGYDFIKTMKLEMVGGRGHSKDFASDSAGYILNEAAVKKIGYTDPVGKPFTFWQRKGTIIGVVKDFHFNSLHVQIEPMVLRLGERVNYGSALIRTKPGQTKAALQSLQKLTTKINPQFPFTYKFSDEEYQNLYKSEQVISTLSGYFAFLAIFISCLGVLGLAIFTAEQRTREIGIRKVLGASVQGIVLLLSKDFLRLVMLALVIASPLAWYFMNRWLQDYAYATDISWWIFPAAGVLAILITLLTIGFQAVKTAMINPVKSLRTE